MTKEEALKKLADIIFYAAKSGYMPYDTNDELCAMSIAKKHIEDFYTPLPSNLDEAMEEEAQHAYGEPTAQGSAKRSFFKRGFKAGVEWRDAQIPKMTDNINNAAKEYANIQDEGDKEKYVNGYLYNGFYAGAEWMAGQGVHLNAVVNNFGEVAILNYPNEDDNISKLIADNFEEGDKVVVQIRKKYD